jgi:ABC-type multidrug transport system ATPase subunit
MVASPQSSAQGPTLRTSGLCLELSGKRILDNINLTFLPGRISSILGPSGSGKSTLIKCLTTVLRPTRGRVTVDGKDLQQQRDALRPQLGYVPQDDIIHRELRVEQAFDFAARLRLDEELSAERRRKLIAGITRKLGLAQRRRMRIGRLSGGQRKRVNIGIELLADPTLLVLDEPASGLDPATEEDLLKILAELAGRGKTVVLTTHSMEYLDRVDSVVVLSDGAAIFCGPLPALLSHFEIEHPAEVFRTIRGNSTAHWVQRWAARSC